MNFNFLFGIVGNLNFIITFLLDEKDQQDFFLFDGVDSAAHLYRYNKTIYLQLNNGTTTMLYKTDIENMLEFSWTGFKVNGTEMVKVGSNVTFPMTFNTFTFLTPLVSFSCLNISNAEKSMTFQNAMNTNYGYIVGIVLLVAIVFDIKPRTWNLISKVFNNLNDCNKDETYVTMNSLESKV